MALRASCAELIRRLRDLVGDPDSDTWQDATLQDALDDNRTDARYVQLIAQETRTPGELQFLDFYSTPEAGGNWEADAFLNDAGWNTVNPDAYTADFVTGHWTFTVQPLWPLTVTGKTFDLFATAADILEKEVARLRRKFDVTEVGGAGLKRSQMITNIESLAATYRGKAQPVSAKAVRTDTHPGAGANLRSGYPGPGGSKF